jgi:hypothetical protein
MHTQKNISSIAQFTKELYPPESTTYTEEKSQFLGLQLSRQILSVKI